MAVVVMSLEDERSGCGLDIRRGRTGYSFLEWRRDPEARRGWRPLAPERAGYDSAGAAIEAARRVVGWLNGG